MTPEAILKIVVVLVVALALLVLVLVAAVRALRQMVRTFWPHS
jgi:hypothetical protein